jgi:flagellar biosynthesis GTPase FlhF
MSTQTAVDGAGSPQGAAHPAVRELARRLLANGSSPELARRVLARVESRSLNPEFTHPLDVAAREIGNAFPRVVLRARRNEATALAFLGARGSGRSAVTRKLALRLRERDRPVAVLALEQPGSTQPEWLATWLVEIGVRAHVVTTASKLQPRALRGSRIVLVDGAGELSRDEKSLDALAGGVGSHLAWRRVGVLAADAKPADLRAQARDLRAAGASCAIVTRFDRAEAPATALEIAGESGLPVAFVCDGARDERHLHRLGPERAADVFLTGKIA